MVSYKTGASKADVDFYTPDEEETGSARDRLLQKINAASDLPALGSAVSRVVQLASSDGEAVSNLAHFILSDVALTQKILRIANTVTYRAATCTQVTTVSRAIFLLGFDTVKTSALAMLLVEGMSGRQGLSVRTELSHAFAASIIGREIARRSLYKDAEEAAVAALFKNIGRVLVASYEHELYDKIVSMIQDGSFTAARASMEVLGCSFDLLGESVLYEWNIPDTIIQALAPLPSAPLKVARGRQEWLQHVVAFSTAAATLIRHADGGAGEDTAIQALLARFGAALNLDREKLDLLFANVVQETDTLINNINTVSETVVIDDDLAMVREPLQDAMEQGLPDELVMKKGEEGASHLQITERHASGKPVNARDLLLAGVQEVTQMMASRQCTVNDLMLLVLETLYSSMGFRFATVCLKDIASAQFRARIAMGANKVVWQAGFKFPVASMRDLFYLAMENDADLMISDATVPKIQDLLPAWHKALLPDARSFIVLPLVVNKKQVGLFYADRTQPALEGVPTDETSLLKTLKGQVLAALQQR